MLLTPNDDVLRKIEKYLKETAPEAAETIAFAYEDMETYGKIQDAILLFNAKKRNIFAVSEESCSGKTYILIF